MCSPTRWVCLRFSSNVEDGASQSVQVYCVSLNGCTLCEYMASQDFPTPVGRIELGICFVLLGYLGATNTRCRWISLGVSW